MTSEERVVLLAAAALVAVLLFVVRSAVRGSRGISRAAKRYRIARKHDAIIAKFRADCISLGIEVD